MSEERISALEAALKTINAQIKGLGDLSNKIWSVAQGKWVNKDTEVPTPVPTPLPIPEPVPTPLPIPKPTPLPIPEPEGPECPVEIAGNAKWRNNKATIAIDYRLSSAQRRWIEVEVKNTIRWVESVCDLELILANNLQSRANVFITIRPIDGRGNVLGRALQWILRGFFARVRVELDQSDLNNTRQNIGVLRHELLHAFGVKHSSTIGLMFSRYTNIIDFGEYEETVMGKLYKDE